MCKSCGICQDCENIQCFLCLGRYCDVCDFMYCRSCSVEVYIIISNDELTYCRKCYSKSIVYNVMCDRVKLCVFKNMRLRFICSVSGHLKVVHIVFVL